MLDLYLGALLAEGRARIARKLLTLSNRIRPQKTPTINAPIVPGHVVMITVPVAFESEATLGQIMEWTHYRLGNAPIDVDNPLLEAETHLADEAAVRATGLHRHIAASTEGTTLTIRAFLKREPYQGPTDTEIRNHYLAELA